MKNEALGAAFSAAQAIVISWSAAEYPGHTTNDIREPIKQDILPHAAKMIETVGGNKKKHRENTEKSAQIKDIFRPPGGKEVIIQGDRIVPVDSNTIKPIFDLQKSVPEMKRHLEHPPKPNSGPVGVRGPQSDRVQQRKVAPERFR